MLTVFGANCFRVPELAPDPRSDPVEIMLGDYRTPELWVVILRAQYGLDQPLPWGTFSFSRRTR